MVPRFNISSKDITVGSGTFLQHVKVSQPNSTLQSQSGSEDFSKWNVFLKYFWVTCVFSEEFLVKDSSGAFMKINDFLINHCIFIQI